MIGPIGSLTATSSSSTSSSISNSSSSSSTLCLKKVPTFKLSVTLSNLNRFWKFYNAEKRTKFATKFIRHYPPHLRHVATLPWEITNSNLLQIFSRYRKNANELHFMCIDFNSCTRVTNCMLRIFMCFIKICPRRWIPCWLSVNTAVTSAVTSHELPVPQIDRESKQVKEQWYGKFYLQSVSGNLGILNSEIIKICGWITKLEVIKMQFLLTICRNIYNFNFPR